MLQPDKLIVITLNHPKQFEFLKHVFQSYTNAGLPADELPIAADTYLRLMSAQEMPVQQNLNLGNAAIKEWGPNGLVLETESGPSLGRMSEPLT